MRKIIWFCFTVIVVFVIYFSRGANNSVKSNKQNVTELIRNYTSTTPNEKFVTLELEGLAGLGNQLFRIASLYGIAKKINRTPYLNSDLPAVMECYKNYAKNFPKIVQSDVIKLIPASNISAKLINFFPSPRTYVDPINLINETDQYIKLSDSYVQDYLLFDEHKSFLKGIFQCDNEIVQRIYKVAENANWNHKEHNFCVHTRRGDFVYIPSFRHSSKYFTIPATKFVLDTLKQTVHTNINLIYSGDDVDFTRGLYKGPRNGTTFVDVSGFKFNKYENLCFHIHFCDTILLTATGSSYGWMMGYLKERPGNVYYDGVLANAKTSWVLNDYVPPWWHRICVECGTAKLVDYNETCQGTSAYPYKTFQH